MREEMRRLEERANNACELQIVTRQVTFDKRLEAQDTRLEAQDRRVEAQGSRVEALEVSTAFFLKSNVWRKD